MAKSKFGIQFDGFTELAEKYDKLGGDLQEITADCLKAAHEIVTPKITADMVRHHRTGRTQKSIVKNARVEWEGTTGVIDVGFNLKNGGMPSIFLMYGTPRMKKDTKLYNDIYGSTVKKQIAEKQDEILTNAIQQRLGG